LETVFSKVLATLSKVVFGYCGRERENQLIDQSIRELTLQFLFLTFFLQEAPQDLGKVPKKLSVEKIASIIAHRKAGMKTQEIIACTGRIVINTTSILAASRVLTDQDILQRKKGSGKPRKDTKNILNSL
jgi:hypothetical protein